MLIIFWYLLHSKSHIFLFNFEAKNIKTILLLRRKAGFLFSPPFKLQINNLFACHLLLTIPIIAFYLIFYFLGFFSGQYIK